jgi:putative salt-induced outer membrane protein YdiY
MQDYATSTAAGVDTVSRDQFQTLGRYRYNMDTTRFFQSVSQYGYSRVNNIDQDYLQSLGFGWRIVQTKLWYFCLTPSMSAQYQVINSNQNEMALAPTLYEEAEYKWTDTVKIHNEATAIFPITGSNEPTYHFAVALQNKIIGNAFISIEYNFDYDGAVENSKNARQQSLRTSFGVDF